MRHLGQTPCSDLLAAARSAPKRIWIRSSASSRRSRWTFPIVCSPSKGPLVRVSDIPEPEGSGGLDDLDRDRYPRRPPLLARCREAPPLSARSAKTARRRSRWSSTRRTARTLQLKWWSKEFAGKSVAEITADAVSKARDACAAETFTRGKPRKDKKTGEIIPPKEYRRSGASVNRHIATASRICSPSQSKSTG